MITSSENMPLFVMQIMNGLVTMMAMTFGKFTQTL